MAVGNKEEVVVEEIVNARTDKREYRRIVLPNSLKCAASMDVNVGAFSDPDGLEGLAHFLEHMLFYASEKYPSEDSYSKYISEHGGRTNAYTASENTNYYFDINSDGFEEALDRLAQFFINPLMSADTTMREIKAVDSENQNNLLSAGESDLTLEFSFFKVDIDLTDAGHDHMQDIVGLLFKYISLLQQSGLSSVCETKFHYQDKIQPINYVVSISPNMQSGHYPNGAEQLSSDNVRIFWESKKFEGHTNMSEPWYGTPYSVERITGSMIQEWILSSPNENLHLPARNVFIPTDLSLKNDLEKAKCPVLLRRSPYSTLWYKPDTMFFTPKAYVKIAFTCPHTSASPETEILTNIFTRNDSGVQFIIQSKVKDPAHIDLRVEEFLKGFETKLYEMPNDEFKSNVNALIDMKLEKHRNLREEAGFYWGEISVGTLKFDRKESEIAALRQHTQQEN
ncbi:hypothetical protein DVH24_019585 [Malus domestica]|uniref:Peptidase M16 N-terminal domain-containing protein n=1 Tax=Malus domestica TaxID=3750 RepID=A0A498I448_MALDO|nr:hypothetical protein DVH24_019585 [Malus domestica]